MIFVYVLLLALSFALTPEQLNANLTQYVKNQSLMGLAVQVAKNKNTIYRGNFGYRDYARNLTVDNSTCFRVASLSKNVAATGLYLLI